MDQSKEKERQQFTNLLVDSLILLFKNGILTEEVTKVDGTICITLESGDVFIINLKEVYEARKSEVNDNPLQRSRPLSPRTRTFLTSTISRSTKRKREEDDEYEDNYHDTSDHQFLSSDDESKCIPTPSTSSAPKRGRPRKIKELMGKADADYVLAEVESDFAEGKISQKVYEKIKFGEVQLKTGNIFVWKYFDDVGERKSICLSCHMTIVLNEPSDLETMWDHALACENLPQMDKDLIPQYREGEKMKNAKKQAWGRTFRSKVWNFFARPPGKALCLLCENFILKGYDGNVRTLWNHVKVCPASYEEAKTILEPELDETDVLPQFDDTCSEVMFKEAPKVPKLIGKGMGRHRSSKVWNYFKILPDTVSICKFCQGTMSIDGPDKIDIIGSLWDHLDHCPSVPKGNLPMFKQQRESEKLKQLKWMAWGRKFKSHVWDYFEKPPGKAKCIFCNKMLNCGLAGNTTNLWNHVHSCSKVDEEMRIEVEGTEATGGNQLICEMCSFSTFFPSVLKRHLVKHKSEPRGSVRGARRPGRPRAVHLPVIPPSSQGIKVEQVPGEVLPVVSFSQSDGTTLSSFPQPSYQLVHLQQDDSLDLDQQYIEVQVDPQYITGDLSHAEHQYIEVDTSQMDQLSDDDKEDSDDEMKIYECFVCRKHYERKRDLLHHIKEIHTTYIEDTVEHVASEEQL